MLKAFSKFAIRYGLIPLAYWILRLYFATVRVRSVGEESFRAHLKGGGRAIVALWHQRILVVFGHVRCFGEWSPSVMVSQSRDGEMIADIYRRLNVRPVRGSSSRGGRKALAAMVADLAEHPLAGHILDGPQGPRGVIKAGLVSMAQLSGAPVFPVYASVNRAWVLASWDRFLIPKPFSTVTIRWDEPISVPASLSTVEFEAVRRRIEERMRENQALDDRAQGWPEPLL
jgi:hypothetical protein